ncbi:MAG: DUF11 domain-containing protein [Desulfobacula sp.]|uniref:InlB B-repeat-containing protein n=1 Tax=Desulfobacula sp. TaxID=2593537 RepID=UPI0025C2D956|nr:hypothetical protein [Desulfobacula sp.]MCD4722178.1 DUF11 domain-containing protein [Desulfobacula sp.]
MSTSSRKMVILLSWVVIIVMTSVNSEAWEIQTGDFIPADTLITYPDIGVSRISDTQISVDRNGDGLTASTYDLPSEIQPDSSPEDFFVEYRLSPTRQILYSWKYSASVGSPAVCGGDTGNVRVFFHKLDDPPGSGMTNLMTNLETASACMPQGVDISPLFYDKHVYDPIRTVVVVSGQAPPIGIYHTVLWVDLKNGGANLDADFYKHIIDEVEFAPSGNAAFIRHGYNATTMGRYDNYALIDLCGSPLGNIVTTRAHPDDITTARVNSVSTHVEIKVMADSYEETFLLDDCSAGTEDLFTLQIIPAVGGYVESNSPVIGGILCYHTGDCEETYLNGQTVDLTATAHTAWGYVFTGWSGDCSGTNPTTQVLMDADKTCTATFGHAFLEISKTSLSPSSVPRESNIEYALDYENGSVAVSNVVIEDTLSAGVSFVSANSGGTESGGIVTWNLGTLAANATGQVTFTVSTDCDTLTPVRNDTFSITSTETGLTQGMGFVETTFDAASTEPVTIVITSIPQNTPLRSGNSVTHGITLTNTELQTHHCLRMVIRAGTLMDFGTILNDGGGMIDQASPNQWEWRGTIGAGNSTTISFTTVVEDCLYASFSETRLNGSQPIRVQNADGVEVGSGMPPGPFPVQKPVTLSYSALNLGPAQSYFDEQYQVSRPGANVDFQIVLTNVFPENQSAVSVNVQIPDGFTPVGDPPFISPTDTGATFDGLNKTISWTGPIPGNSTVTITYLATLEANASCRERNVAAGVTGSCANLLTNLTILKVPEPPGMSYLTGLDSFNGLFTWTPGVDQGFQELLCLPAEFMTGLSRSEANDLWVSGRPTFRFNPYSLDFVIYDNALYDDFPENTFLRDVAFDGDTDTAIFLGNRNDGGTDKSAVKRYDPDTGLTSDIIDELPVLGRIVVDPDGMIAGLTEWDLFRIDPGAPANYQTFAAPGILHFNESTLSLDRDGDFLVQCVEYSGLNAVREPVLKMDRQAGTFAEIIPDLAAVLQVPFFSFNSSSVGPSGEIYFGKTSGNDVAEIHRGGLASGTFLSWIGTVPSQSSPGINMGTLAALVYTDACPENVDMDSDLDLDGLDLSAFIANLSTGSPVISINAFSRFFGRTDCPN